MLSAWFSVLIRDLSPVLFESSICIEIWKLEGRANTKSFLTKSCKNVSEINNSKIRNKNVCAGFYCQTNSLPVPVTIQQFDSNCSDNIIQSFFISFYTVVILLLSLLSM